MVFQATHPVFGDVRFDGGKLSVQNDSLSQAVNELMGRRDDWPALGIGVGQYAGGEGGPGWRPCWNAWGSWANCETWWSRRRLTEATRRTGSKSPFNSLLREMGLEHAPGDIEVHLDPESEPAPGEPPRIY
jgi:hypothetical protein